MRGSKLNLGHVIYVFVLLELCIKIRSKYAGKKNNKIETVANHVIMIEQEFILL